MKQKLATIVSSILLAFVLMLGADQLRAQSGATSGPIRLTVALAGSSTVALGEPVLLKYVITNTGQQKADVFTGDSKQNSLITERFTDTAGKMLVPSVSPIPTRRIVNGMIPSSGLVNLMDLRGNTSTSWETVANAYVTFPHPGHYLLRVHVQNPYVIGDDDQGPRQLLTGDSVFPLTVVAANPTYLRATAARLRSSVLATPDLNVRAMLVKALFSMPEATASESWQTLVEEPGLDGYSLSQITTALARIHTTRAADILAQMVWEPAQQGLILDEAAASQHLYEIYDTGDSVMKRHIEDLHKQRGAEMSHFRVM